MGPMIKIATSLLAIAAILDNFHPPPGLYFD